MQIWKRGVLIAMSLAVGLTALSMRAQATGDEDGPCTSYGSDAETPAPMSLPQ